MEWPQRSAARSWCRARAATAQGRASGHQASWRTCPRGLGGADRLASPPKLWFPGVLLAFTLLAWRWRGPPCSAFVHRGFWCRGSPSGHLHRPAEPPLLPVRCPELSPRTRLCWEGHPSCLLAAFEADGAGNAVFSQEHEFTFGVDGAHSLFHCHVLLRKVLHAVLASSECLLR